MKRFSIFLLFLIVGCALNAQDDYRNYVLSRTMLNGTGTSYLDNITYYDGLGRPFQTVQKAVSDSKSLNKNLVTLQEYDAAGREWNSWLPTFAGSSDYLAPASIKSSAPGNYDNDSRPYSQPVYEASPLNRLTAQYGPGVAWYNAGRSVKTEYLLNTNASPLKCIKYGVNSTGGLTGNPTTFYTSGELSVVKTTDEDLNVSYSFTDKQGHTVLTRQMNNSEEHDTYYIYNDKGNLCFVLQPKYQESADLGKYAFQYEYDACGRCTKKKLPGADFVEYTYNAADQLVFSQDGNQRAQGSTLRTNYLYDKFGRLTEQQGTENIGNHPVFEFQLSNYYDGYGFLETTGFDNIVYSINENDKKYGKGMLTGSSVAVLGSFSQIHTAYYYDAEGRVVKTVQNNLLDGFDVTETVYTFSNQPSVVTHVHTAAGNDRLTETYIYSYDHNDRLAKVEHTLNGTKVTLADYIYDDLGRLEQKNLHGLPLHRQEYKYNVRALLTSISGNFFGESLYYYTGDNPVKCYNGNISSVKSSFNGPPRDRSYQFRYDGLNRLTDAHFSGHAYDPHFPVGNFAEHVTAYDKNGNILGLRRYGQTGIDSFGLIDSLTYTLDGNRITRVDDAATASAYGGSFEFKDGVKQAGEYLYDANGNLTKDLNKGITDIQYNFLNLPSKVTFSDGSTISCTYAADGTKLRTLHKVGSTTTTTDYCGNVIYENGIRKYLLTEEGYVSLNDGIYHYFYKDHLGNVRLVIGNPTNSGGKVEERNDYYPFGGLIADLGSVQPYKYNGKELDTKKGLNWYDYGAREYDAALGVFTTLDPSSEKYYSTSPYAYCGGNPINRIDPTGADWYRDEYGNYHWVKAGTNVTEGWTPLSPNSSIEIAPAVISGNPLVAPDVDAITGAAPRASLFTEERSSQFEMGNAIDLPIPVGGLVAPAMEGVSLSSGALILTIPLLLQGDESPAYVKEATDSKKNEKHGDSGRAMEKAKKKMGELENKLQNENLSRRDRNRMKNKKRHIREDGEFKNKGEEHSHGNTKR